jgi:hypothetical protein
MLGGLPYTVLRDAILTHPTMAEGLNVLFANVKPIGAEDPYALGRWEGEGGRTLRPAG